MATLTVAPPPNESFTLAHSQELVRANDRAKSIRRAARVAGFNGWVSALAAMCSAPFAVFGVLGLLATVVLAVVAWNEFRGRKRLLAFDPSAAALLGWNQIGLLAMIIAYCLWMLYTGLTDGSPLVTQLQTSPDVRDAFGNIGDLYRQIVVGFYGLVILLSVIFQGGNAYYYFSRRRHVEDYLDQTPAWVRELQRAAAM